MRKFYMLILAALFSIASISQTRDYRFVHSGSEVQDKNFYLFTLLQKVPEFRLAFMNEGGSKQMRSAKIKSITKALQNLSDSVSFLSAFRFQPEEMQEIRRLTGKLYAGNNSLRTMVPRHLRSSGYFAIYDELPDSILFINAFIDACNGINNIINTYGLGQKPLYGFIDSVSYDVRSSHYRSVLVANARILYAGIDTMKCFFEASLNMALSLLYLNHRDEAARFEPLISGENKKAVEAAKTTRWENFPYAAIVVPGFGPEDNHPLDPLAKLRLKLAVERFKLKSAPFIIVSGGNVHPFQTVYNEAYEMKKELMEVYGIPEASVIMEPHARHTTTNIRNANRLLYRYGFPFQKPVLITTTVEQSRDIGTEAFAKRCLTYMKHVPFVSLKRVSIYDLEYVPVKASLHMLADDPLDP